MTNRSNPRRNEQPLAKPSAKRAPIKRLMATAFAAGSAVMWLVHHLL